MSYSLQTPSLPKVPLSSCTDEERKIQGKCWDLKAVQKDLQAGKLQILLTTKAVAEASKELRWSQVDVLNFFLCLETRHYQSSQWCLPPNDGQFSGKFAADAYVMGYDRVNKVENPNRQPHVYLKFAVLKTTVLIFSFHPNIYWIGEKNEPTLPFLRNWNDRGGRLHINWKVRAQNRRSRRPVEAGLQPLP